MNNDLREQARARRKQLDNEPEKEISRPSFGPPIQIQSGENPLQKECNRVFGEFDEAKHVVSQPSYQLRYDHQPTPAPTTTIPPITTNKNNHTPEKIEKPSVNSSSNIKPTHRNPYPSIARKPPQISPTIAKARTPPSVESTYTNNTISHRKDRPKLNNHSNSNKPTNDKDPIKKNGDKTNGNHCTTGGQASMQAWHKEMARKASEDQAKTDRLPNGPCRSPMIMTKPMTIGKLMPPSITRSNSPLNGTSSATELKAYNMKMKIYKLTNNMENEQKSPNVEDVLMEMSLPPPLTAITTPRTENSAFSFPKSRKEENMNGIIKRRISGNLESDLNISSDSDSGQSDDSDDEEVEGIVKKGPSTPPPRRSITSPPPPKEELMNGDINEDQEVDRYCLTNFMKKNSTPPTKKQDYNANSTTQDELNKKVPNRQLFDSNSGSPINDGGVEIVASGGGDSLQQEQNLAAMLSSSSSSSSESSDEEMAFIPTNGEKAKSPMNMFSTIPSEEKTSREVSPWDALDSQVDQSPLPMMLSPIRQSPSQSPSLSPVELPISFQLKVKSPEIISDSLMEAYEMLYEELLGPTYDEDGTMKIMVSLPLLASLDDPDSTDEMEIKPSIEERKKNKKKNLPIDVMTLFGSDCINSLPISKFSKIPKLKKSADIPDKSMQTLKRMRADDNSCSPFNTEIMNATKNDPSINNDSMPPFNNILPIKEESNDSFLSTKEDQINDYKQNKRAKLIKGHAISDRIQNSYADIDDWKMEQEDMEITPSEKTGRAWGMVVSEKPSSQYYSDIDRPVETNHRNRNDDRYRYRRNNNNISTNTQECQYQSMENPYIIDAPFESYMDKAREIKHRADGLQNAMDKFSTYIVAGTEFMRWCYAYEMDPHFSLQRAQVIAQFVSTLNLIKHKPFAEKILVNNEILKMQKNVLLILCYRMQSHLNMKLYRLKRDDYVRYKRLIDEHNKNKNISQSVQQPSNVPSPHSPQPSPADSASSIGSNGAGDKNQSNSNLLAWSMRSNSITDHLAMSHEQWDYADALQNDYQDFFSKLDRDCGTLNICTLPSDLIYYVRTTQERIMNKKT